MSIRKRLLAPLAYFERLFQADLRYVIGGNIWITVSQIIATGSGIVLTIAFANLLTPDQYGFFKYVISLTGIFGAFSLTGLGTALINSIARGDDGILRATFTRNLLYSALPSAVGLAAAGYYLWHGNMPLAASLGIFALTNPWLSSFGNYRHVFTGKKEFFIGALYTIPRTLLPLAIMLGALLFADNPVWVVFAYFIGNTIAVALVYWRVVKRFHIPRRAESVASTMSFARMTSVLSIFNQVASQIDQFLVWHFLGPAAVAMYSMATSPIEQIQGVAGNIFILAAPKFATKDTQEIRRVVPLRMKQMYFITVPLVLAYIALAPLLFTYVFPKYIAVTGLTQIYALVLLLQPQGFIDAAFVAQENTGARARVIALGQGLKIIFLALGIWKYGIVGGIVALIAAEIANMVIALSVFYIERRK